MKSLHWEISDFLHRTEKSILVEDEPLKTGIQRQIIEMKDLLKMERNEYEVMISDFFSRLTRIYQGLRILMLILIFFFLCRFCSYQLLETATCRHRLIFWSSTD